MNMNPMQMLQMIRGGNPQQVVMNLLRQNAGNNPILTNALQLYQNGKYDEIEKLVRNMCAEKNINPDEMMQQLKSQFGK